MNLLAKPAAVFQTDRQRVCTDAVGVFRCIVIILENASDRRFSSLYLMVHVLLLL
jgi:hypothetical protein